MLIRGLMMSVLLLAALLSQAAVPCPKGVHPLIDGQDGNLFGGGIKGKWVDAEHIVPKLKGRISFRLYNTSRLLGVVSGSDPSLGDDNAEVQIPSVKLGRLPAGVKKAATPVIGICGDWDALPRKAREQRTDQPIYRELVRDYLAGKGLSAAPINIHTLSASISRRRDRGGAHFRFLNQRYRVMAGVW